MVPILAKPVDFSQWSEAIQKASDALGVSAPKVSNSSTLNAALGSGLDRYPPSDADKIADQCAVLGDMRRLKGANQDEQQWYSCIGVLRHTTQGEDVVQEWSSGHDDYDPIIATDKMNQWEGRGPTLCDTMRQLFPACAECKLTCNSPITLGYPDPEHHAASTNLTPGSQLDSPLARLKSLVANGNSETMEEHMLDAVFVIDRLAILGQATVFFASPNAGKTLLTFKFLIQSVLEGLIDPSKVYYVNCDDTFRGSAEKLKIAEQHDINMLIPGQNGFMADQLLQLIVALTNSGEARGIIFILDTIKKFTDLMDKKTASQFTEFLMPNSFNSWMKPPESEN